MRGCYWFDGPRELTSSRIESMWSSRWKSWNHGSVNPGRPPTPIGGDGIEPWVVVPHWFLDALVRALSEYRIEHRVELSFAHPAGARDPDDYEDRVVFLGGDVPTLQSIVFLVALQGTLEASEFTLAVAAIAELGKIGPAAKDAIPTLEKLTEHDDRQIAERAKAALRQVRGR